MPQDIAVEKGEIPFDKLRADSSLRLKNGFVQDDAEQMRQLALVEALDVGVGVDAWGVGLVGFPELGSLAERDAVS